MDVGILTMIIAIVASAFRLATPLIFAALGGLFSERSGVVNIALEGILTVGAFTAITVTLFTNMPWIGVLAAVIAGILLSLILGVIAIHFKGDQVVAGVAINLLAISLCAYLITYIWGKPGGTPPVDKALTGNPFEFLEGIPGIGKIFSSFTPFVYLSFVVVAISYYVLYKTPFGLRLRAVGEHPKAADTVGIKVYKTRYICVMISGALAGLGGAAISIGTINIFSNGMVAGKGFIALAALIFGKWHPTGALLACLFFGLCEAIQIQAQTFGIPVAPELLQMLPYAATILALIGVVGKSVGPAASGKPYEKAEK